MTIWIPAPEAATCRAEEPGSSAEPALVTDRPDQTESAALVPPGSFQLELGWLLSRDEDAMARLETREAPGALLRIGVTEGVELRLGGSGWVEEDSRTPGEARSTRGLGDAEVGAKFHLRTGAGRNPETALLVSTSVPVGERPLSSGRFEPALRLLVSQDLSRRASLGYNLGVVWSAEEREGSGVATEPALTYTAALGYSVTGRLGAFVEVFGERRAESPEGWGTSADGGFTFLLRPDLQLDLAGGVGLSESAPDWFLGLGLSVRFPR